MQDLKESLEIMREMVVTRIQMLQDRTTFYDEEKRSHYSREYTSRLLELDQQILNISLTMDAARKEGKGSPPARS